MPQEADSRKSKGRSLSAVSAAFLENNTLLKGRRGNNFTLSLERLRLKQHRVVAAMKAVVS